MMRLLMRSNQFLKTIIMNSDTEQHMSKDVVTSLENIVGAKWKDDWKIARSK